MSPPSDKSRILAALRGARPESEPIEIGGGVRVTLRLVAAAAKERMRDKASAEVPSDAEEREDRIYGSLVMRILAAALAHHGLTHEDLRDHVTAPVLRVLWGEYERLEALVSPATDKDLDALHDQVRALVGESRSAAATHLSGFGYTMLLRYAISTVGRQSA
jgi:hypothetical protein